MRGLIGWLGAFLASAAG